MDIDIAWEAPEFQHYEKNSAWYFTFGTVAVLLLAYLLIMHEYFSAITLAIVLAVGLWFATHTPRMVVYGLSDRGVHIDGFILPFGVIKFFWIVKTHEHNTLNLEVNSLLNRHVIIELEDSDATEIRHYLKRHIKEHHRLHPTFAQQLRHKLKF